MKPTLTIALLVSTIGCDSRAGEQSLALDLTAFGPSTAAAAGPGMGGPSIEHLGRVRDAGSSAGVRR